MKKIFFSIVLLLFSACTDQTNQKDSRQQKCCTIPCISKLGYFQFFDDQNQYLGGVRNNLDKLKFEGFLTLKDSKTDIILFQTALIKDNLFSSPERERNLLIPYLNSTIKILVQIESKKFKPYSEEFLLPVQEKKVCCDTCPTIEQTIQIRLKRK
ncbi:MAG TPA: hypothetical protein DHW82_12000 [Spirochaetia bacterium]|nr:MAG: hypothetical protein A2Y41_05815 [Spirochaetes bacterium GWB1_36_13]HCL57713.1 hypothetical protein [Spirochaetia bacterium]